MRILLIEDDLNFCETLRFQLEQEAYEVDVCHDGRDGLDLFLQDAHDIVLLDRMLPTMNGLLVLQKARQSGIFTPVILITALGELYDRIEGLDAGADDYIVKPFEMLEVMVRLEKVLERNGTVQEQIQIGDVIIDTASRTVTKMGMEIYLKPMEYNCLMVFAKNPNKALTRNQILQELWNEEFCGETRTVDAHVGRIRKKLGWQDKIKTIPRIGYRLEVDL